MNPYIDDPVEVVKFMRQLKKHKGPLFTYKKNKLFNIYIYKLHSSLKDFQLLFLTTNKTNYLDKPLMKYHPYIHIFHSRPRLSSSIQFVNQQVANLTAECEWLKAQMKYPPLAKEVRYFDQLEKQRKESQTYLARFYQVDRQFLFHEIFIAFPTQIEKADHLELMLTSITAFRIKLISQLKNHDLISEQQTRYLWKVIVRDNQLELHILIVRKIPTSIVFSLDNYKARNSQRLKEQINKTAEKLSITINKLGYIVIYNTKQDTAKDKRKIFNKYLEDYFKQDFWFPYYRIPCKEAKKKLFGKGNDKDGQ